MLSLATDVASLDSLTTMDYRKLVEVAEKSCCGRYHCNKAYGTYLSQKLALRWLQELQITFAIPFKSTVFAPPSTLPNKPVVFAKYEVEERDTLVSQVLSPIKSQASKHGSWYIFTYTKVAFAGMIKIGYSARRIDLRFDEWAVCGHGRPVHLDSCDDVRNPERVEALTHYELMNRWYAQRWCNNCARAHIEWFKIDVVAASSVARLWSRWMNRANPYDRRGHLKRFWRETIDFLMLHEVPITARVMMEVQDLEEEPSKVLEFIDDDTLRQRRGPAVKQEQINTSQVFSSLPTLTEVGH